MEFTWIIYHIYTENLPDSQKRRWLRASEDVRWERQLDQGTFTGESDVGTGDLS